MEQTNAVKPTVKVAAKKEVVKKPKLGPEPERKEKVKKPKLNPELQKSYKDSNDYVINLFTQDDKYYITTSDNKEFVNIDNELAKEIIDKAEGYYNLTSLI